MRSLLVALTAFTWAASGWAETPERKVGGHIVYSPRDPRAEIHVPEDARYAGSDTFFLSKPGLGDFDVCELHAFANAGNDGVLNKLYWVHFEHLLPNYPKLHYTYDSKRHVKIGGLDFFVDTEFSDGTGTPKPGSDAEHFYKLLAASGYKRSPMMFVRFVHLTDATARKELMVIVGEALPEGVTSASLQQGGKNHALLPALESARIESALRSISITGAD